MSRSRRCRRRPTNRSHECRETSMPKLRVHNLAISIDGYAAGPDQSLDNPLGVGGPALHEWMFATRTGRQMSSLDGGSEGIDDEFAARGGGGPPRSGPAGGETPRRSTTPCSCSPTTHVRP